MKNEKCLKNHQKLFWDIKNSSLYQLKKFDCSVKKKYIKIPKLYPFRRDWVLEGKKSYNQRYPPSGIFQRFLWEHLLAYRLGFVQEFLWGYLQEYFQRFLQEYYGEYHRKHLQQIVQKHIQGFLHNFIQWVL